MIFRIIVNKDNLHGKEICGPRFVYKHDKAAFSGKSFKKTHFAALTYLKVLTGEYQTCFVFFSLIYWANAKNLIKMKPLFKYSIVQSDSD